MTYKVYIRKNCKPEIREKYDFPYFGNGSTKRILVLGLCLATGLILGMRSPDNSNAVSNPEIIISNIQSLSFPVSASLSKNAHSIEPVMESIQEPDLKEEIYQSTNTSDPFTEEKFTVRENTALSDQSLAENIIPDNWESLKVSSGDNLSLIFNRLNIKASVLHEIMSLGNNVAILKRLMPDHEMRILLDEGELEGLQYDINYTDTLHVIRDNGEFKAETVTTELETRVNVATGIISDSLFLTAQRAGLNDNITMQLVDLYGWDIDFALDIREGDRFYVIYEEKYKNGIKVQDGPILAAEFVNQSKSFRAVRYTNSDGYTDYYNENGYSMRKAFLRTPVNFTRISSRFSLGRKHPILNKIRAHKGVDYAAPTGTPVKAAGDGIVAFAGNKGGYGRAIILRHGEKYGTLYGHLSKYANGIRNGSRVKQGQIIGYVGMSGLATGPHLHYEFRINGVHRNPLTVELPKAEGISNKTLADFKEQTIPLLAQLDNIVADGNNTSAEKTNLALLETEVTSGSSQ